MKIFRLILILILFTILPACSSGKPVDYRAEIKNVILIVIDTLRANHMGCYGYDLDTTPAIDALAASGVVFDNAYTPQSITTPAFTALFTGMHPTITEMRGFSQIWPENLHSLVEDFQESDFYTTGIGASSPLDPKYGFDRGMDDYSCNARIGGPAHAWMQIEHADKLFRAAGDNPIFMMLHFWEPHSPMTAPERVLEQLGLNYKYDGPVDGTLKMYREYNVGDDYPIERLMNIDDLQRISDLYDADVRWLDNQLGLFLEGLKESRLFNNSLIVITADHGETLGENHRICHGGWTKAETHIPLIFHFPGDKGAGTRVPGLVDITDIMPTMMDISGVKVPEGINGRSRLSMIEDPETPGREYVVMVRGLSYPGYGIWDGEWRREVDFNPLVQEFDPDYTISEQDKEALRSLGY